MTVQGPTVNNIVHPPLEGVKREFSDTLQMYGVALAVLSAEEADALIRDTQVIIQDGTSYGDISGHRHREFLATLDNKIDETHPSFFSGPKRAILKRQARTLMAFIHNYFDNDNGVMDKTFAFVNNGIDHLRDDFNAGNGDLCEIFDGMTEILSFVSSKTLEWARDADRPESQREFIEKALKETMEASDREMYREFSAKLLEEIKPEELHHYGKKCAEWDASIARFINRSEVNCVLIDRLLYALKWLSFTAFRLIPITLGFIGRRLDNLIHHIVIGGKNSLLKRSLVDHNIFHEIIQGTRTTLGSVSVQTTMRNSLANQLAILKETMEAEQPEKEVAPSVHSLQDNTRNALKATVRHLSRTLHRVEHDDRESSIQITRGITEGLTTLQHGNYTDKKNLIAPIVAEQATRAPRTRLQSWTQWAAFGTPNTENIIEAKAAVGTYAVEQLNDLFAEMIHTTIGQTLEPARVEALLQSSIESSNGTLVGPKEIVEDEAAALQAARERLRREMTGLIESIYRKATTSEKVGFWTSLAVRAGEQCADLDKIAVTRIVELSEVAVDLLTDPVMIQAVFKRVILTKYTGIPLSFDNA